MIFFKRAKQDKNKESEAGSAAKPGDASEALAASDAPPAPTPVDPATLGFKTTADIKAADSPVVHERALDAIAFGAGIKGPGYNILVIEGPASLSHRAVRAKIESIAVDMQRPPDWVYAGYFESSGYRALKLPAGRGKAFAEGMEQVIDRLAEALPAAFAADDYDLRRRAIEEEFRLSREDALEALRREAEAQNIALLRTPSGIAVAPILEGKVVRADVFNSVPESLRREVHTKISALEAEIEAILAERPEAEKARRERLLALNEQVAGRQVRAALEDLLRGFGEIAGVERFVKAAGRDLVRNAGLFLAVSGHDSVKVPVGTLADVRIARYRVHVMATSDEGAGAPVVAEQNPTYANLFGRVELGGGRDGHAAQVVRIRPGALHRANGGFLLLEARALLAAPAVADALVRALEADEIRFDPPTDPVGMVTGEVPDLESIPLAVKLIVVGSADVHRELARAQPLLKRHFKVEAVFDETLERSPESISAYASLIAGALARGDLKPVDAGGVALLIDEAARKAGGNGKLSLEIGHVADICREADHWARNAGRNVTSAADIERVLQARREVAGGARAS